MFEILRRLSPAVLIFGLECAIPMAGFTQKTPPPPKVYVDEEVKPKQHQIPGGDYGEPRLLAAVVDGKGNQGDFVEGELLLFSKDPIAVEKLAARWGGKVVASFDPAKAELVQVLPVYRVRINPYLVDPYDLPKDLQSADPLSRGELRVSSKAGLGTLAAAARAYAEGTPAGVNWILESHVLRDRTSPEATTGFTGPVGEAAVHLHDPPGLGHADVLVAAPPRVGPAERVVEPVETRRLLSPHPGEGAWGLYNRDRPFTFTVTFTCAVLTLPLRSVAVKVMTTGLLPSDGTIRVTNGEGPMPRLPLVLDDHTRLPPESTPSSGLSPRQYAGRGFRYIASTRCSSGVRDSSMVCLESTPREAPRG